METQLRSYQARALTDLRLSLLAGNSRPIIQSATGSGKTVLAAAIVEGAQTKGNRVAFVVPFNSLIDQTVDSFKREGITDIGVMQADHPMTAPERSIQVCSIQTIGRRSPPGADVVIVDECHIIYKSQTDWMALDEWSGIPFIGLSATPWTKGLGLHWDDLIIAATTSDLIEAGYLSDFDVFAAAHPDLGGVKTTAGDFNKSELADAVDKPDLNADVVETWLRLGENRQTICFAVNRAHAKNIQARFVAAGIPCGYQDAHSDRLERRDISRRFHAGDLRVVSNIGTLTTGVDWPDITCIILARPTKSISLFVQMIGRGLRIPANGERCLILDHSDTHRRLGFVTDISHDRLDDGTHRINAKREYEQALPRECTSCSFLKPAKVRKCPACGFQPETQSQIDEDAEAELVELKRRGAPKKEKATMEQKQIFYSGLIAHGKAKGFKFGWAANKYREKFGVWPNGLDKAAGPITQEVRNFITAGNIRWARSKEKREGVTV